MFRKSLLLLACAGLLSACSSGPSVRSDFDRSANFAAYQTYGFVSPMGTDKRGNGTIISGHFKTAISREMEARGYRLAATNPDLLVNVNVSSQDRVDVQSTPSASMGVGYGYYGYRGGMYGGWPMYSTNDVSTTYYKVGTGNIDVVDAARKQLVWEGIAEARLTQKMLDSPGPAIDKIVTEIFLKYPAHAGAAAVAPPAK
jgi:Domain of unknown function (DUF4136)